MSRGAAVRAIHRAEWAPHTAVGIAVAWMSFHTAPDGAGGVGPDLVTFLLAGAIALCAAGWAVKATRGVCRVGLTSLLGYLPVHAWHFAGVSAAGLAWLLGVAVVLWVVGQELLLAHRERAALPSTAPSLASVARPYAALGCHAGFLACLLAGALLGALGPGCGFATGFLGAVVFLEQRLVRKERSPLAGPVLFWAPMVASLVLFAGVLWDVTAAL